MLPTPGHAFQLAELPSCTSETPAGTPCADQWYGGVPPWATIGTTKLPPTTVHMSGFGLRNSGCGVLLAIWIENCFCTEPFDPVAVIWKVLLFVLVGVPESTPAELRLNPPGNPP